MNPVFEQYAAADVADLIAEYPLAWVAAAGGGADRTALLPLLAELDASGGLARLVGHMSRRNPLFEALTADPGALILFQGPHGYVSPNAAGLRDWGPTWNYAQVAVDAQVVFEPEQTGAAVDVLVARMEQGQPAPWTPSELGDRYAPMASKIVGFSARPTRVRGVFKLGQDEPPEVFRSILANTADPALARWMRRFTPDQ